VVSLRGLAKYTFVATAIQEATTTINLERSKDTAFFLHDAYSAFYTGLTLTADSSGRQSHQRVLNVDTIFMGSGGGTSIVDLTSKDYVTGAVTVYGADKGRSIFWGTDANDTFISGGGDSVIFGGAGSNSAFLGAGRDTLQYRAGVGAVDRVEGFDPSRDVVEFWTSPVEKVAAPVFSQLNGSTMLNWGGNTIEFVGLNLTSIDFISRSASIA
jgi:Ca2+-binding RTX toxin-like protein